MNTIKRYLLSVLFLCVSLSAFSQASVYPIDLSAVMLPPYTNCLGDYFSNGRVQLKAIVKDMSRYGKDATLEYSISVKVKRGNTVVLSSIAPLKRKFSETQIINDIPVKELFSDRNNYTGTASGSFFGNGYCLEEGSYEFEYQLFDKNKGNMPLSEPFSVYCYLTQAEPPVGVFPEDGKCYDPSEIPQTMLFQWIDPIAIGPQTRSYELHIKEDGTDMAFTGNMFPKQEAPSSMELYNQSVFNNNFVLINNSASKFREGHKYYWYVQMRGGAADGTNNNAYKNGGKSQTYSFSIGNCNQEEPKTEFDDTKAKNSIKSKVRIELDSAKVVGGAVKTMWELKSNKNDELICGFKVYCYKVDGGNSDEASEVLSKTLICGKYKAGDTWTEKLNSSVFEEGVEYFCFVRPVLQNGELGLMSNELSFKIESAKATASPSDDDDCIVELTPRSCVGDSLLTSVPKFFFANDAHQVISVDVNETKMEGQTFTGSGIVTPAWLKNIVPDILPLAGLNVEFEKIKINTDGYLCEGEIKVVSDPDNNLYFDLNELVDFNAGATVASKQKEVFTKEVEKEEDIKGDQYKGEVVRVKSTGDLFAVSMANGELQKAKVGTCLDKNDYCPVQYRGALNSKGISLRFDVDTTFNKDTYSPYIDKNANPFTAQNILDGYVSSGSDYIQPWISMVQGEYKWIKAYFEGAPDVDPNNVEFYLLSKNSLALLEKEYVSDDNYFKVKIYGGQPSKSLQIVARSNAKKTDCSKKDDSSDADSNASDDNSTNASSNADASDGGDSDKEDDSKGSGDKKCEECGDDCVTYGSAQIYMLSSKKVKVMLVPVVQSATDNNLNIDDLKAKVTAANEIINKRFAPLGREFELVVDDAYEYADIPDEGFNVSEDNSEWTKETDEMKALRKAYGLKVGKRDEYQACLFLLTQAKKDGLQGYMPRSNSVGFIFLGNNFENVQSDIMAHELCHGLYGLQHTFAYPGAEEGALRENLMDYVDHNDERYLSKYFQWNNMERFNGHVFKLLDDVEDGEFNVWNRWKDGGIVLTSIPTACQDLELEGIEKGRLVPFLSPGALITFIPSNSKYLTFERGCLISFCIPLANGKLEKWTAYGKNKETMEFYEYRSTEKSLSYKKSYPKYYDKSINYMIDANNYFYYIHDNYQESNCKATIISKGFYSYKGANYSKFDSEFTDKFPVKENEGNTNFYKEEDEYNINCLSDYYKRLFLFLCANYDLEKALDKNSFTQEISAITSAEFLNRFNSNGEVKTYANYLHKMMAAEEIIVDKQNKKEKVNGLLQIMSKDEYETTFIKESGMSESQYTEYMAGNMPEEQATSFINRYKSKYNDFTMYDIDIYTIIEQWRLHYDENKNFIIISDKLSKLLSVETGSNESDKCSSENWSQEYAKIEREYNIAIKPYYDGFLNSIGGCCTEALSNISYDDQLKYLKRLLLGDPNANVTNVYEKAILKVLSCIQSDNYSSFYKDLEASNNSLLKSLMNHLDDVGFGGDNYTALFNTFTNMYKKKPYETNEVQGVYLAKMNIDEYTKLILDYELVSDNSGNMNLLLTIKTSELVIEDDAINGKDLIYYNDKIIVDKKPIFENYVSPLTPILVVKSANELPLVGEALDKETIAVVPLAFMKYRDDKIFNHHCQVAAEVTADVLTLLFPAAGGVDLLVKTIKTTQKTGIGIKVLNVISKGCDILEKTNAIVDLVAVKPITEFAGYDLGSLQSAINFMTIAADIVNIFDGVVGLKYTSDVEFLNSFLSGSASAWHLFYVDFDSGFESVLGKSNYSSEQKEKLKNQASILEGKIKSYINE